MVRELSWVDHLHWSNAQVDLIEQDPVLQSQLSVVHSLCSFLCGSLRGLLCKSLEPIEPTVAYTLIRLMKKGNASPTKQTGPIDTVSIRQGKDRSTLVAPGHSKTHSQTNTRNVLKSVKTSELPF